MSKVKIYSTPTCPYCIKAKELLKNKGIEFENIDVSSNQEKAQEMINVSGQMSVPVITVDEKIIIGFDPDEIEKALSN